MVSVRQRMFSGRSRVSPLMSWVSGFVNVPDWRVRCEGRKDNRLKGGFYLKLAQNIVFLFSSEMRGSTIRLYTDDRFYRKILKYK